MFNQSRRIFVLNLLLVMALLGSAVLVPAMHARADSINPRMTVTLLSGNNTYASTVYVNKGLTFEAKIKNTGNVPLNVTANLTVPSNWDVDEDKYSECDAGPLAPKKSCLVIWKFTPQAAGQVTLRVYVRGNYTDSANNARRITSSPAFIFNVKPPKVR